MKLIYNKNEMYLTYNYYMVIYIKLLLDKIQNSLFYLKSKNHFIYIYIYIYIIYIYNINIYIYIYYMCLNINGTHVIANKV